MRFTSRRNSALPIIAAASVVTGAGLALAWAAYMRRYVRHDLPLVSALNGALRTFQSGRDSVAYYASAGASGKRKPPMVLVHGVSAAASAYEMRPLFDHFAQERRVYALDLPGFGFSDRLDAQYSPGQFAEAILDFISRELHGGPADVVAQSLSCEFVALAARAQPKLFRTLTLLSPTGLSAPKVAPQNGDTALRILSAPAWSQLIFDTIVSRPALRLFLRLSQRRAPDLGLADYAYLTSHQPGAKNAPIYFAAGKLSTPDIIQTYRALTQPTLILFGRDLFAPVERADELTSLPNLRVRDFTDCCGGLLHFDDPARVFADIDAHIASPPVS